MTNINSDEKEDLKKKNGENQDTDTRLRDEWLRASEGLMTV